MIDKVITWPTGLQLAHYEHNRSVSIFVRSANRDAQGRPIYRFSTREPAWIVSTIGTSVQDTSTVLRQSSAVPYYVYGLSDPRIPDEIRYVGLTGNPHRRWLTHYGNNNGTPVSNWVKTLRKAGLRTHFTILEVCFDSTGAGAERYWITKLGSNLVNGNLTEA